MPLTATLIIISFSSPTLSFIPDLKPSFSANPPHCSLSFSVAEFIITDVQKYFSAPPYAPATAETKTVKIVFADCLDRTRQYGISNLSSLKLAAGYISNGTWFARPTTVTHPSTNRARRWVTSSMRQTTLPQRPDTRPTHPRMSCVLQSSCCRQSRE